MATIFNYNTYYQGREEKRVSAMQHGNAQKYHELCEELGVRDIEDPELYEMGALESSGEGRHIPSLNRTIGKKALNRFFEHFKQVD